MRLWKHKFSLIANCEIAVCNEVLVDGIVEDQWLERSLECIITETRTHATQWRRQIIQSSGMIGRFYRFYLQIDKRQSICWTMWLDFIVCQQSCLDSATASLDNTQNLLDLFLSSRSLHKKSVLLIRNKSWCFCFKMCYKISKKDTQ